MDIKMLGIWLQQSSPFFDRDPEFLYLLRKLLKAVETIELSSGKGSLWLQASYRCHLMTPILIVLRPP